MWTVNAAPMSVSVPAAMKIGDLVLYLGRHYYLRGLDPMSVPNRQAFLEDALTGEEVTAPVEEIEPGPANGRFGPAGV
jgi:hypothetical protein